MQQKYTLQEKLEKIIILYSKIKELGINNVKDKKPLNELDERIKEFIKGKEYVGKIKFKEINRIAEIQFRNLKSIPISINFKFNKFD